MGNFEKIIIIIAIGQLFYNLVTPPDKEKSLIEQKLLKIANFIFLINFLLLEFAFFYPILFNSKWFISIMGFLTIIGLIFFLMCICHSQINKRKKYLELNPSNKSLNKTVIVFKVFIIGFIIMAIFIGIAYYRTEACSGFAVRMENLELNNKGEIKGLN